MAEYTYADIIMDPNDPRLEGAIGKECYFSDYPKKLLNGAIYNLPEYLDCLTDIKEEGVCTFVDKNGTKWALIIIKKAEPPKPKYVPFDSKEEFVRRYTKVKEGADFDTFEDNLFQCGMWLRSKVNGGLFQVVGFLNDAVYLNIRAFDTNYQSMLDEFTFLDGSPCGKESKDV